MIWNETFECMDRETMRKVQGIRLRETVERVYHNAPFYRKKMQEMGVTPEDIQSIDDITKLPFTSKEDLRDNYPFGLFSVPMSEVVRLHASSGTTGKPTVVGYTRKDLTTWNEVLGRALTSYGIGREDFVQIAYGYGLFTGGLGIHFGTEKVGASVIPISGGNTHRQLQLMQDFGTTVLACTPSYALYLAEAIEEAGINREDLKLRTGVFGAEPWTEEMRKQIEDKLKIKAFDIYGLSEVIGPGVAFECDQRSGLHINEDHFYPEIVNPKTFEQMAPGEEGELVFTTITKEGLPLLRYRTKDLTTLVEEKCECGRSLIRMKKCTGRSDDMLIIRGVNVFPSQVESVLMEINETLPHYLLIVERNGTLDTLSVMVEVEEQLFSDEMRHLMDLQKKIRQALQYTLGISVEVKLVEPKTIERTAGKAKRVIDKR